MNSTEVNTSNRTTTVNTPNSSAVFSTSNRSTVVTAPANRSTVVMNTLAAVGFVAFIGAAMWLAVYSTRYVPTVVNGAGAAAVYLGSIFNRSNASLSVVPTSTSTSTIISFGEASSTISTSASSTTTKTTTKTVTPTAGEKTTNTVQISGMAADATLSGLPDLTVTSITVGYLTTCQLTDSFTASSSVPTGNCPAVKFTIKNIGTNATGSWRFSASIPTQSYFLYQSQSQQSLNPGDSIDYTLGFDQAIPGADKMISITANFDHAFLELTTDNNNASEKITILGN